MKNPQSLSGWNRRQFLATLMPACALTCLGAKNVLGGNPAIGEFPAQETKHKFDAPFDRPLTFRQFFSAQYGEFIKLAKALENEMGREKLLDFLKKNTEARLYQIGQQQAKQSPDQSFATYVNTFKGPGYDKTLTMEIIEDTAKVFELKVTECIWASVFLQAKAGEIGSEFPDQYVGPRWRNCRSTAGDVFPGDHPRRHRAPVCRGFPSFQPDQAHHSPASMSGDRN